MQAPAYTSSYHIESLARGLSVLSAFSEEQPALSLTDISQRLQLNKTTTFRLLCTLESLGYLERDPQTKLYRPALEVLRLGFVVLNSLEVRQVAAPYLRQLVEEIQETVNLAVLDNHEVVCIDRVGSKHLVNVYRPVGSRLPAYCTSMGKALLAFLPPEQLEEVLADTTWVRHNETTIVTPEVLKENLALVRQRGFADSDGELIPELRDVSAPIHQYDGQVVAALNISTPAHRVSYEKLISELGPKVVEVGQKISEALGYHVKRVA
jgi:PcaR/PcaU/PobR family beta-ketoadipate pathway transcriptional regulator